MRITTKYDMPMNGIDVYSLDGISGCGCNKKQGAANLSTLSEKDLLINLRSHIIKRPTDFASQVHPANALNAIDQLLKNWDNPTQKQKTILAISAQRSKIFINEQPLKGTNDVYYIGNINDEDYVIDLSGLGKGIIKKVAKKTVNAVKQASNFVADKGKAVVKAVVKFSPATVIARQAYRGLLALNVRGWANAWHAANIKDSNKVRERWEKWGGNYGDLMSAVNAGIKKPRLLGINGLGSATGVAASIAAATPIIVEANKFLKETTGFIDTIKPATPASVEVSKQISPASAIQNNAPAAPAENTKGGFFTTKNIIIGVSVLAVGTGLIALANSNSSDSSKPKPKNAKK